MARIALCALLLLAAGATAPDGAEAAEHCEGEACGASDDFVALQTASSHRGSQQEEATAQSQGELQARSSGSSKPWQQAAGPSKPWHGYDEDCGDHCPGKGAQQIVTVKATYGGDGDGYQGKAYPYVYPYHAGQQSQDHHHDTDGGLHHHVLHGQDPHGHIHHKVIHHKHKAKTPDEDEAETTTEMPNGNGE